MNIWQSRLENIFYFHHWFIVRVIICVAAVFAVLVIYMFLYTSPAVEIVEQPISDEGIKQDALTRVLTWSQEHREESIAPFSIPNSAFANIVK